MRKGIAVVFAVLIGGCGEGESKNDQEASIRSVVRQFSLAAAERQGTRTCALITSRAQVAVAELASSSGTTIDVCADAVEEFEGDTDSLAFLDISEITISGDQAIAKADSGVNPKLQEQGGKWRISNPIAMLLSAET